MTIKIHEYIEVSAYFDKMNRIRILSLSCTASRFYLRSNKSIMK